MFCPRCGRQVNETANFCGGCGLSKIEIEKYAQPKNNAETVSGDNSECNSTVECNECSSQENTESEINQYSAVENNVDNQETSSQENTYTQPNTEASYTQSNTDYSYQSRTNNSYTQQNTSQSTISEKNQNMSTVDFIWTIIISGIPIVGFIYLIYLAIQDNNINKRSFARATLIVGAFCILISILFFSGILFSAIF